jgi:hypothetical protein
MKYLGVFTGSEPSTNNRTKIWEKKSGVDALMGIRSFLCNDSGTKASQLHHVTFNLYMQ